MTGNRLINALCRSFLTGVIFYTFGCARLLDNHCMEEKTKPLPDIIGSTHVNPGYFFGQKECLNEGADQLLNMGSRVIKVWFYGKRHEHPEAVYSYNSEWPKKNSLAKGAESPYWKELFDKPFTTYILCVTSMGRMEDYWLDGISQAEEEDETRQFYELTKHFLTTYKNSGKTFILQHWEGDWMTRMRHEEWSDENIDPDPAVFDNMIRWLNARQAGVNKAKKEIGEQDVHVYHAAEVNRVLKSLKEGKPNMVNRVIPFTNIDLVSYSSYDSIFHAKDGKPQVFGDCVEFIKDNLPPSAVFGRDSVYLGEFGVPENEFTQPEILTIIGNATETALEKKCPYIVYWQLYCNEPHPGIIRPSNRNKDFRGFWLIRADGSRSPAYNYFHELLNESE